MRRLILCLAAAITACAAAWAGPAIRDIDVNVVLHADGTASVTEVWDVTVTDGTEWYLVRDNLDGISIYDLSVTDENGQTFTNEGDWDVDRSRSQKAGKCGIVQKRNGCELCWGVGSYGDHTYTVTYTMSGVVDSYTDYDAVHLQLVSPGLSSNPKHVKVTVSADTPLNTIDARGWGFGFPGTTEFKDGAFVMESTEPLSRKQSVILLLRLNQGLFTAGRSVSKEFQTCLDKALKGASFADDEADESFFEKVMTFLMSLLTFFGWFVFPILALFSGQKRNRKKILGCKLSDVGWSRDIPFGGNILEADYVLEELGEDKQKNSIAGAMILRMIKEGYLSVRKDAKDKIEICFNDAKDQSGMSESAKELYAMMKEASGSDQILQDKEFSRWSNKHTSRVSKWVTQVKTGGKQELNSNGFIQSGKFTPEGQAEARKVVGFKKYLNDFTIIGERASQEVALWHDYLVFAALYGIADKVAKELKDINPKAFEEMMVYDYGTMNEVVRLTRTMGNSITNARASQLSSGGGSSRGGFGGHTSIGGGGGFHGGGFGGGSR